MFTIFFNILKIGFIVFIILNILTKNYLWKLIKNIFLAMPLFIQDLVRMDKTVFRGYGFWCFSGLGGSGKTISIVDYLYAMKQKYPKLKILTNFTCNFADGKIESWRDLLETENIEVLEIDKKTYYKYLKWGRRNIFIAVDSDNYLHYFEKKNHGVLFGFDEIHLTFESTAWEDAPSNLLDYISQQRKLHKQIVATSQVFTRINKKLREQTNLVVECKSLLLGRVIINKYYHTVEYIANDEKMDKGRRKRKTLKREVFIAKDNIRNMYNTEEILKDIKIPKSANSRLLDLIKNYSKGD